MFNQMLGVFCVVMEDFDNCLDIDFFVIWVLVVIVCYYSDGCVVDFCFVGEFSFWYIGYIDYVIFLVVVECIFCE